MTWTDTYRNAHHDWQRRRAPGFFYASGGDSQKIAFPPVNTANGLTRAVINYLMWKGHRATRIASSGRIIKGAQRQESGTVLTVSKYIPGQTRRGTADISSTIYGRSVMIEIKVGKDRPSEYQLREQQLEEAAGGIYIFIHTIQEFFAWYDQTAPTLCPAK